MTDTSATPGELLIAWLVAQAARTNDALNAGADPTLQHEQYSFAKSNAPTP